jgi:hypothetical protein
MGEERVSAHLGGRVRIGRAVEADPPTRHDVELSAKRAQLH